MNHAARFVVCSFHHLRCAHDDLSILVISLETSLQAEPVGQRNQLMQHSDRVRQQLDLAMSGCYARLTFKSGLSDEGTVQLTARHVHPRLDLA